MVCQSFFEVFKIWIESSRRNRLATSKNHRKRSIWKTKGKAVKSASNDKHMQSQGYHTAKEVFRRIQDLSRNECLKICSNNQLDNNIL